MPLLPLLVVAAGLFSPLAARAVAAAPAAGAPSPAETWLERLAGRGFSGAVLAIDDGEVVIDRAFGLADVEAHKPMPLDSIFDVGSITKQFTAAAILALDQDKKLAVSDLLSKYVGPVPADKAGITLEHLLTHSAGFPGEIGRDEDYIGADDYVKLALAAKLDFEPGSSYSYSNVGFALLGIVVEKVTGKGYEAFLRERFFEPLGMKDTGYVLPEPARARIACCYRNGERWGLPIDKNWHADGPGWHLRGNGGMLTTLADMRRWIESLDQAKVLDETHCEELFVPRISEGGDTFYGYGWSVFSSPLGGQIRTHNGGNGVLSADLWWHPQKSRLVFVTSTRSEWVADHVREGIIDFLNGQSRPLPSPSRQVDPSESAAAHGTYRCRGGALDGATFEVESANGALRIDAKDSAAFAVLSDPGAKDLAARIEVSRTTDAIVTAMQSGDYAELGKHYRGPREPGAFVARVKSIIENRTAEVGAWSSHATLGPAPFDDGIVVWVRCVAARDTAYAGFLWNGDHLTGLVFRDRPPLRWFYPVASKPGDSTATYESFSLMPADTALPTVRIELRCAGGVRVEKPQERSITVVAGDSRFKFEREGP